MGSESNKPSSENELVAMFKNLFEPADPPTDLLLGIGDDAAVFEPGVDPETKFVVTTDMLVEDVHFIRKFHSFYDIGWRSAVANISDIAAMGAHPRWGVASLAATGDMTTDDIMEFARGINNAMRAHSAFIIGGDLASSKSGITVSITLIGETTGRIVTRSGAQLGDQIAVTGNPGMSGAGLALLLDENIDISSDVREKLIQKHLRPEPRVLAGKIFANNTDIHSMMDLSDGLGIDLARICEASEKGARVFEEQIPVAKEVIETALLLGRDPLEFVNSGEDFELLITGDERAIEYVSGVLREYPDQPKLTVIGEIIDKPFGMHLARVDGSVINPAELGWDHFKDAGS